MKDFGKMIKDMERDTKGLKMEIYTLDDSIEGNLMEKEFTLGLMEKFTMANGKKE